MRVQAIAKPGGLWVPWPGNLPEGTTLELDVVEVIPGSEMGNKALYSPETLSVINTTSTTTTIPDKAVDAQTLDRLLDALYCAVEYTASDKSDEEIWHERMLEKHG